MQMCLDMNASQLTFPLLSYLCQYVPSLGLLHGNKARIYVVIL